MTQDEKFEKILARFKRHEDTRLNGMIEPVYEGYEEETQCLTLSYTMKEWELNSRDTLHGGIIATFFDIALGANATCAVWDTLVTLDLNTSYLRPVSSGDTIIVKSYLKKVGRVIVRTYGEAFSKRTGKMIATAYATFTPAKA